MSLPACPRAIPETSQSDITSLILQELQVSLFLSIPECLPWFWSLKTYCLLG
jgi:hypothetical protein